MKIGMMAIGTHGSIYPIIEIARQYKMAGNEVMLITGSIIGADYQKEADAIGIKYEAIPDFIQLTNVYERLAKDFDIDGIGLLINMIDHEEPRINEYAKKLAEECDELVCGNFCYPVKIQAGLYNKPHTAIILNYAFVNKHMEHVPLYSSTHKNLLAFDIEFLTVPLPDNSQVIGFLPNPIADDVAAYDPDEFIDAYIAPVFITLGNLIDANPAVAKQIALNIANSMPEDRFIIQVNNHTQLLERHSDKIVFIGKVNYESLFPLCKLIIHHAGVGTMNIAAKSGVRNIAVPLMDEQLYNAKMMLERGLIHGICPIRECESAIALM